MEEFIAYKMSRYEWVQCRKVSEDLSELELGKIYVRTKGHGSMKTFVEKANEALRHYVVQHQMQMEYEVVDLDGVGGKTASLLRQLLSKEENFIMRVSSLGIASSYYFIGTLKHYEPVSLTLLPLVADHYEIMSRYTSAVLLNVFDFDYDSWLAEPEDECDPDLGGNPPKNLVPGLAGMLGAHFGVVVGTGLDACMDDDTDADFTVETTADNIAPSESCISLPKGKLPAYSPVRGSGGGSRRLDPSSYINGGVGNVSEKEQALTYEQLMSNLQELADCMPLSRDDTRAMTLIVNIIKSMPRQFLYQLVREMFYAQNRDGFLHMTRNIFDRLQMGEESRYNIVVKSMDEISKENREWGRSYYLYAKNRDTEELEKMPFANRSCEVLYLMSLIEKSKGNNKFSIVNVQKNEEAFVTIYKKVFEEESEQKILENYNKILNRSTNEHVREINEIRERQADNIEAGNLSTSFTREPLPGCGRMRKGRISDYYNSIEKKLFYFFQDLDENPSPFIVTEEIPLAIPASHIELPEELRKICIQNV